MTSPTHPYAVWIKDDEHETDATLIHSQNPETVATQYAQSLADQGNHPDHIGHPLHLLVRNQHDNSLSHVTIEWDYNPIAYPAHVQSLPPDFKTTRAE